MKNEASRPATKYNLIIGGASPRSVAFSSHYISLAWPPFYPARTIPVQVQGWPGTSFEPREKPRTGGELWEESN